MKLKHFYIAFLLVFTACGTAKIDTSKPEALSAKEVVKLHQDASPDFETIAGRMQLAYETEDSGQRISVNFRIKKDEVIWAKASILGITIAKVYITPQSVQYYETIGKTYFDGDFSLLSDWLGTDINFEQAQNILLGQSIFYLSASQYSSSIQTGNFRIAPKKQPENFKHSIFLNANNFKVVSASLEQPEWNRILTMKYDPYQKIGGYFYPTKISIVNTENREQTKIEINYRKIDINENLNFPFEIPDGYKRITL